MIGRNAPCSCGSGKRYKQCCGTLESPAAGAPDPLPAGASLPATMVAALAAQRANKFDAAERLYRRALAIDPENIDALHMLGVVRFSRKDIDEAELLIRKAAGLCPRPIADISHNLLMLKERRVELDSRPGIPLRVVRESQLEGEVAALVEAAPPRACTVPEVLLPARPGPAGGTAFTFPPIRLFTLENAVVDAESEFPASDRIAIFPDLLDFTRHRPSEFHFGNFRIASPYTAVTQFPRPISAPVADLRSAVVLTSSHWSNWAHFLTEQLPKIVVADHHEPWRDEPFLISTMGLSNTQDLLNHMLSPGRRLIRIPGRVALPRGQYVSTVGYCPFDYHDSGESAPAIAASDAVFSPDGLDLVRHRAHQIVGESGSPGRARLYLKRRGKARRMVNADEVEARFLHHGFTAVAPETLPVIEQIRLFAGAAVIAGQAGAALANMVFAPAGARLLALAAYTPHTNYHYFANMAHALGHRLDYLFCEPRGNPHHPAHTDLEVDIERLDEALETLLSR